MICLEFNNNTDPERLLRQKECIDMVEMLNRQIELIFKYWYGEITDEEFERCKLFSISEEVDKESQIDRFY